MPFIDRDGNQIIAGDGVAVQAPNTPVITFGRMVGYDRFDIAVRGAATGQVASYPTAWIRRATDEEYRIILDIEATNRTPHAMKGKPVTAPASDPSDDVDLTRELQDWWIDRATEESGKVVPKAVEYGGQHRAADLIETGRNIWELLDIAPEDGVEIDEGFLQEAAVYFYVVGKLGRWKAALREGRRVSDDTIFDIGIYVKIVQRIREVGGWPK